MDRAGELEACLDLESDPAMVAVARAFVVQALTEWEMDALVPDAQLIASELVSNAVLHARTAFRLTVRSDGLRWLRVEVYDQNTRLPLFAACPEDATSGRGLTLIAGVGASWGVVREQDGKTVWAELGVLRDEPGEACVDLRDTRTVTDALDRIEASRVSTDEDGANSVSPRGRRGDPARQRRVP